MKIKIVMIVFLIVSIVSCKKDTPATTAAPVPTIYGKWADNIGCYITLNFNTDKTYVLTAIGTTIATGTFTVNSSVVTLKTKSDDPCPSSTATYSFVVTATTLKLSLISDPCSLQKSLLTAPFVK